MKILFMLMVISLPHISTGTEYYVDGGASRSGGGTREQPFKTIGEAARVMKAGDECIIKSGTYFETVRPAGSGTEKEPILFKPFSPGGSVSVFGADPVPDEVWERVSGNIYKANVSLTLEHENQVFHGREMMVEARWPNAGDDLFRPGLSMMDTGTTPEKIIDTELPERDYTGAHLWMHTPKYWGNWTTKILNSGKGFLEFENIAPFKGSSSWHIAAEGAEYFIFGCRAALDSDNEWYYDDREQMLYVYSSGRPADIFIKKRMAAFDLRDRAHIVLQNIEVIGAAVQMDEFIGKHLK